MRRDVIFSRMTGSGSVCYGLFDNGKIANKALNKLKKSTQILGFISKNCLIFMIYIRFLNIEA